MKRNFLVAVIVLFIFVFSGFIFAEEKEGDLLKDIQVITDKLENIEKKVDKISKEPGVKINGELKFSTTDVLFMGKGSSVATYSENGETMRYRPMIQYLDLVFNTTLSEKIYLEGTFRVENIMGGYWGAYGMYGIKKLFAKGELDFVDFYLGDYPAKNTSFTLMPVENKNIFESDIFKWKREDNKKELNFSDDAWPLSGIAVSKNFKLIEGILSLNYKIFGAFLGREGGYNIKIYDEELQAFVPYIFAHNQFLYSVTPGISLFNIADIKGTYLKIFDAKDSGALDKPAKDNSVISIDGNLNLLDRLIMLTGEYAIANYDPAVDYKDSTITGYKEKQGLATKVEGKINLEGLLTFINNIIIKGGFLSVEKDFVSYGAQTRIYDSKRNNQFILTQNNTWNVNSSGLNPQSYEVAGGMYPFTRYNNSIVTGFYLPYDIREELAFPYGEATPNRQGMYFGGEININNNKLTGTYGLFSEIEREEIMIDPLAGQKVLVKLREFQVINAGALINIFGININGGIKKESVENGSSLYPASLELLTMDGGLKYNLFSNLTLLCGIKQQQWKGKEVIQNTGKINIEGSVNYNAIGIEYKIYEQAGIKISYSKAEYEDLKNKENNFSAQEVDFNASFKF